MAGVTLLRLKKEMEMIEKDPPPGCSAWAAGDSVHELEAVIQGADDTPYAKPTSGNKKTRQGSYEKTATSARRQAHGIKQKKRR